MERIALFERRWEKAVARYKQERIREETLRVMREQLRLMEPPEPPPLVVDFKTAMWFAKLQPPSLEEIDHLFESLGVKGEMNHDDRRKGRGHVRTPRG